MPEVFSRDFGVPVPVEGRSDFKAGSWEVVDVIVMNKILYITYVMLRLQYTILYLYLTISKYHCIYNYVFIVVPNPK